MRYYAKLTDEQILMLLNVITHVLFFTIPLTMILLVCCSCGSTKDTITQVVEHVSVDTIYLSTQQYDSIYIYQDKLVDRSRDTLYIKDKSVEFRYKLLRDTIRITQRDSIPYEVTVIETKEITRPRTTFDTISYWCFGIVVGMILYLVIRLFRKLKYGF